MNISLELHDERLTVLCDSKRSHDFPLSDLSLQGKNQPGLPLPWVDPEVYGAVLSAAMFKEGSPARTKYNGCPHRMVLTIIDPYL